MGFSPEQIPNANGSAGWIRLGRVNQEAVLEINSARLSKIRGNYAANLENPQQ
jgi:hypothetical protein